MCNMKATAPVPLPRCHSVEHTNYKGDDGKYDNESALDTTLCESFNAEVKLNKYPGNIKRLMKTN